jgi:hypothetical protein
MPTSYHWNFPIMLNATLLQSFCTGFFGYGTNGADHWFISMEEGGGGSESEIEARLQAWDKRGRQELEEIHQYHHAIGQGKWFEGHPPIQRTWAAAIRMVLAFDGLSTSTETVRAYQRDRLGRQGGSTKLSPLFPLPSKSLDHWNYGAWSNDAVLADRTSYRRRFESLRIEHIAKSISDMRPKTVTFFGASYKDYWTRIAATNFSFDATGISIARKNGTKFVICKHPATQGITTAYFLEAAKTLKDA